MNQTLPLDRQVRVFISSTFRDMQAERDVLMKFIFPKLRKMCASRGVAFTEVDLRWGITEEAAHRGEVVPICLAEIERCRPYFIGLLGERYGWVPDETSQELIWDQPWLAGYQDRSVTELEIMHGVLSNRAMDNRASFYFRAPEYIEQIPVQQRPDFVESHPAAREKLAALKEQIRQSGCPVHENYADPQKLGELVLHDLTIAINQDYPPGKDADPLDQETAAHASYARSRTSVYIGRPEYFGKLNEHADTAGPPLAVVGESGSGKSALLANWVADFRSRHPDAFVLTHFVGASADSSDWARMLRRIIGEIKRRFKIDDEVPDDPDVLRSSFGDWLDKGCMGGAKLVLVLDGLDQLDDRDGALGLVWLPAEVPSNVRLIVAAATGRARTAVVQKRWPVLQIEPLQPEERRKLVREYLALFTKTLTEVQNDQIISRTQTASPLYLRSLLDELRVFGIHEQLSDRIDHYLKAVTIDDLFEKILDRYEEDYESDHPGLVRNAFTLIWAARTGLTESELLEILGSDGNPLPRSLWSPMFLAAETSLINRCGVLGFSHDYFRKAVADRYLPRKANRTAVHRRLAEYFRQLGRWNERRARELPWQLLHAEEWETLATILGQKLGGDGSFHKIWELNRHDLTLYWRQIESRSDVRAIDYYNDLFELPEALVQHLDEQLFLRVSEVLSALGYHDESARLWRRFGAHGISEKDKAGMGRIHQNEGAVLLRQGCIDEAEQKFDIAEVLLREAGEDERLAALMINRAQVCAVRKETSRAHEYLDEAEILARNENNQRALCVCFQLRARLMEEQGDITGMLTALHAEERLCRIMGDQESLLKCLKSQRRVTSDQDASDSVVTLLRQTAEVAEQLNERPTLLDAIVRLGQLLESRDEAPEAVRLFDRAIELAAELGATGVQAPSALRAGLILAKRGDINGARMRFIKAESAARAEDDSAVLAESLTQQAELESLVMGTGTLLSRRRAAATAVNLFTKAASVCRDAGLREQLGTCLQKLGEVLARTGHPDRALSAFDEAVAILEEAVNKLPLTRTHYLRGLVYRERGQVERSLEAFRLATDLAEQQDWAPVFLLCLQHQARMAAKLDNDKQALGLLERWHEQCLARSSPELVECLRLLGDVQLRAGMPDSALRTFEDMEQVCRKRKSQPGLADSLLRQAVVQIEKGNAEESMNAFKSAESLTGELNPSEEASAVLESLDELAMLYEQYELASAACEVLMLLFVIRYRFLQEAEARGVMERAARLASDADLSSVTERLNKMRSVLDD